MRSRLPRKSEEDAKATKQLRSNLAVLASLVRNAALLIEQSCDPDAAVAVTESFRLCVPLSHWCAVVGLPKPPR
jgi:hypothetical protein